MWQVSSQAVTFQVKFLESKLVMEEIYYTILGLSKCCVLRLHKQPQRQKETKRRFETHSCKLNMNRNCDTRGDSLLCFWKDGMLSLSCNTCNVDINKLTEISHGKIEVEFRLAPQILASGHKQYGTTAGYCKRAPIQHPSLLTSWTHSHSQCDSRKLQTL